MLYFDHNATHPLSPVARAAWLDAVDRFPGNPSSPHRLGSRAEHALEEARERVAGCLGCVPRDLIWTGGATESVNTIFHHAATRVGVEVWVSAIEHPSVLAAANRWFPNRQRLIPVGPSGVVDIDWMADALAKSRPGLVAVMAANNETGVLQPWKELLTLCRHHGVPFFCDAAQWIGRLPANGLGGCDFASGCGHKFGGPLGIGFLKCTGMLRPLFVGGPQEDGRRAGTENLPAVLAMAAALEAAENAMAGGMAARSESWKTAFESELIAALPRAEVVGQNSPRLWNTSAVLMPAIECNRRWVVKLDKLGVAVSTGSACSSGQEKPSHVLAAMGISTADASRMLRFSGGWTTTESDWNHLLKAISDIAHHIGVPGRKSTFQ